MKFILSSIVALAIAGVPMQLQEPDDKSKPQQEESKKKPPEPKAKQQPEEKPKSKPEKPPKQEPQQPPRQPDEKQREKQQKEQSKQQKEQDKTRQQEQTARPGDTRRAPAKGQQIPPEKFRASFGREHHFRVARSGGDDRRFRYSGYWFEVVEVWPAGWSFDDDCYIEEDGEDYYLVDVIHPERRVLVIVVSG
jgi:DNA mismatch repair ATPase MutL